MRYSWSLFLLMATAILLVIPICASRAWPANPMTGNETRESVQQPVWDLKYRSGSLQLKTDQWLKAAFMSAPAAEKQTNPAITLSIDQVRAIYFNQKAEKDSDTMQHMSRSGCGYAKSLMPQDTSASAEAFVAWKESPGAITRVGGRMHTQYPVKLIWNNQGVEKEALLNVQNCEYASFVANLRRFAGQRWKDLGREFPR